MSYIHLTIEERCCLREYYKKGLSYREIAKLMGRNVSTVSRELRRNCTHMYDVPSYYPHTAQKSIYFDGRIAIVECIGMKKPLHTSMRN